MRMLRPLILFICSAAGLGSAHLGLAKDCGALSASIFLRIQSQSRAMKDLNLEIAKLRSGISNSSLNKTLGELNRAMAELENFPAESSNDPVFLRALHKVLFLEADLLPQEIAALSADANYLNALTLALKTRQLRDSLHRTLGATLRSLKGEASASFHFTRSRNFREFFNYLYWDLGHPVLGTISPFPIPANRAPTAPIFQKLWRNANYEPSAEERELLLRFDAWKLFHDQKAFQLRNPQWSSVRRWIGHTADFAKFLSFIALTVHAREILQGGSMDVDTFVEKATGPENRDTVFLLVDSVPLPHLALMMNGKIYSYGQTHVTIKEPASYLKSREIHTYLQARGLIEEKIKDEPRNRSSESMKLGLEEFINFTGLAELPPSMQVIALKVTAQERLRLTDHLELQAAKGYKNLTMINDCATMVMRALEEHTSFSQMRLIDASPSQIAMAFSSRKTAGDDRVLGVFQVTLAAHSEQKTHLFRNLWINAMESKLFINFFLLNQFRRLWLDLAESGEIQSWDATLEEFFSKTITERAEREINEDLQIEIYREQVQELEKVQDLPLLRASIESYFEEWIEFYRDRAETRREMTALEDRILDQQKIKLLEELRKELLEKIDRFQQ